MQQVDRLLSLIIKHERWSEFKRSLQSKQFIKAKRMKQHLKKTMLKEVALKHNGHHQPSDRLSQLNQALTKLQEVTIKYHQLLQKRQQTKQLQQRLAKIILSQQSIKAQLDLPAEYPGHSWHIQQQNSIRTIKNRVSQDRLVVQTEMQRLLSNGLDAQLNSIKINSDELQTECNHLNSKIITANKLKEEGVQKEAYLHWSLLVMEEQMSAIRNVSQRIIARVPYLDCELFSMVFFMATELQHRNRLLLRKRMYVSQDIRSMYPAQLLQVSDRDCRKTMDTSGMAHLNQVAIYVQDTGKLRTALNTVCSVFSGFYSGDIQSSVMVCCVGSVLKISVNPDGHEVERCLRVDRTAS